MKIKGYQKDVTNLINSKENPSPWWIVASAISLILCIYVIRTAISTHDDGANFWITLGIIFFSCFTVWGVIQWFLSQDTKQNNVLEIFGFILFVTMIVTVAIAALMIAIAILILYVIYKVIMSFLGASDTDVSEKITNKVVSSAIRSNAANLNKPLGNFKLFGGSTVKCRACGKQVSTDANECPQCGESLSEFKFWGGSTNKCRACGKQVSTDATECPKCGESLSESKFWGGSTIKCRACGKPVSTDANECPQCGESLSESKFWGGSTVKCRACGRQVSTDTTECPKCGEPLS